MKQPIQPKSVLETKESDQGKKPGLFSLVLGLIAIIIWGLMYHARSLEYDRNYAVMLQAFLIWFVTLVVILVLAGRYPAFIRKCWWQALSFKVLASPFLAIIFTGS